MLKRYNPQSVRDVFETFSGIYTREVEIAEPHKLLLISGQIGATASQ